MFCNGRDKPIFDVSNYLTTQIYKNIYFCQLHEIFLVNFMLFRMLNSKMTSISPYHIGFFRKTDILFLFFVLEPFTKQK